MTHYQQFKKPISPCDFSSGKRLKSKDNSAKFALMISQNQLFNSYFNDSRDGCFCKNRTGGITGNSSTDPWRAKWPVP